MVTKLTQTVVDAHGKINWTLDVLERRPDGYHEITSIMQRIALSDTVTVHSAPTGISVEVIGPEADGVPKDGKNIVHKAAQLLGIDSVRIVIEKNLPSQAGLGGGSSDGASALTALNTHFDLGLSKDELLNDARQLGADVSFFLCGGVCLISGYGDVVTPVAPMEPVELVLVKPNVGVSTAEAYNALDHIPGRKSNHGTDGWPMGGPSNDFEEAVFALYPEISQAADALRTAGAEGTLLCGSGATVMGWGSDVKAIGAKLRLSGYEKVWVTRTV